MEWVETTGKDIREAVTAALDLLGVDESDIEYEVVEEPKQGLFGRLKREARIRARVKPSIPRPKDSRRPRRQRERAPKRSDGTTAERQERRQAQKDVQAEGPVRKAPAKVVEDKVEESNAQGETVPLVEQAGAAQSFLAGLMREFQVPGQVSVQHIEDDNITVAVTGESNYGLLIGPKGLVMSSIQELTRASVQNKYRRANGRVFVDIGGFREKRRASLERFAIKVAEEVKASGKSRTLEPMNAADRKVVHDAMAEIDGVSTRSEGQEPRRYIVVGLAEDIQED